MRIKQLVSKDWTLIRLQQFDNGTLEDILEDLVEDEFLTLYIVDDLDYFDLDEILQLERSWLKDAESRTEDDDEDDDDYEDEEDDDQLASTCR